MGLSGIQQRFSDRLSKAISNRGHGYTTELAQALGVSRSKISNIATGRRGSDEETRRKICAELGVTYEEFMRDNRHRNGDTISQSATSGSLTVNATRGAMASVSREGDWGVSDREQYFWDMFRRYGNQALLESFIERLEAVRKVLE